MREELVRRKFAEPALRTYLHVVEDFRCYLSTRLDQPGPDDIRGYQVHLLEVKECGVDTVVRYLAALRYLCKDAETPAMKEARRSEVTMVLEHPSPLDAICLRREWP